MGEAEPEQPAPATAMEPMEEVDAKPAADDASAAAATAGAESAGEAFLVAAGGAHLSRRGMGPNGPPSPAIPGLIKNMGLFSSMDLSGAQDAPSALLAPISPAAAAAARGTHSGNCSRERRPARPWGAAPVAARRVWPKRRLRA